MSFTVPSHITVTFDEYNVPDIQSLGKDFNGANLAKEVWFSFPLETLTAYTVIVNAKREDKALTYRVCQKKTVDGVVYDYFPLDSWFTAKSGRVIMAVKVYKSSDISVAEDGTVTLIDDEPMIVVSDLFALTVNYAPNAISLEPALDPSDVEIIYASIGMKASKSEVPLVVASLPTDLDTLVDGAYKYDNWVFMLTDGTVYRIDDDTATLVGSFPNIASHLTNTSNPHSVTKAQVGLTNADDTSDANKPVSTAQATALAAKVESTDATFTDGKIMVQDGASAKKIKQSPYTIQTLPISTPTQTALNLKLDTKVNSFGSYSRIKSLFGSSILAFYPIYDFESLVATDMSGNARLGAYRSTGVSWVKSVFNDNQPCIKIDGTSGLVNMQTTALANAFSFNEGSISLACQVDGTFGDGITRYILNIYASETAYIQIRKSTSGLSLLRKSASEVKSVSLTNQATGAYGFPPNKPIILTATWSVANAILKFYIDGILVGSASTLESITATPIYTLVGASSPTNSTDTAFKGYVANILLLNRPMLKKEIDILTEVSNTEIKKMLVIGDSITNDNTDFPTYVVNYATKNVFGRSFGVAGNTISSHLATQTSLAVVENADYILLELGTNDNNAGDMSALQVILEAQINRLIASNPRASIYYLNVFPCWTNTGGGTPIDKSNIRTAIAAACTSTGITCVDVSTWLIASNTSDGLHPTSTGSLLIANQIIALLGL